MLARLGCRPICVLLLEHYIREAGAGRSWRRTERAGSGTCREAFFVAMQHGMPLTAQQAGHTIVSNKRLK
jgi:hypothetical protein